ncbi:MAG: FtsX-like permease family protein [Marinoscillum sp.]
MNLHLAFKLAFRSLLRDKLFSLVNIIGLSLGLMSCAFIFIYVFHSINYDRYHDNLETIYRVNSSWIGATDKRSMAITPPAVGSVLAENYSFVKSSATISAMNEQVTINRENHSFIAKNFVEATPSILDVFTFKFVVGDESIALKDKKDIIINVSWANKIFGTTDCLGKLVAVNGKQKRISGVYEDWPQNIDLPMEGVIPGDFPTDNWEMFGFRTYVNLTSNQPSDLQGALHNISEDNYDENTFEGEKILMEAQPLKGMHFAPGIALDSPKGSKTYMYLAFASGCILILILLINISNLGIIRAVDSIKQTGLRKILGASKVQLLRSNVLQLVLIFFISWVLGSTFFQFVAPVFTELTGIAIVAKEHLQIITIFIIALLVLVILTSVYTDTISSSINPILALKKKFSSNLPGTSIRKILVVFQFVITGVVVTGLLILILQWQYIQTKDLGFNASNVLVVSLQNPRLDVVPLNNELSELIGSENISIGNWGSLPGSDVSFTSATFEIAGVKQEVPVNVINYDRNFLNVFDIHLFQGKNHFNEEKKVLINQSLAKLLEEPINRNFQLPWLSNPVISGVIVDYHYQSLHNQVDPLILIPQHKINNPTHLYLKTTIDKYRLLEARILKHWTPGDFKIDWLDNKLMSNYQQELEAISIVFYFSVLSLFISLLGLFGVVSYSLKRRLYEIGIRKVLGAQIRDLLNLFGKEILTLLLIASLITLPLGVFLKNQLLDLYAFKPDFNNLILVVPSLIIVVLAYAIVGLQVTRASHINPTRLLRDE